MLRNILVFWTITSICLGFLSYSSPTEAAVQQIQCFSHHSGYVYCQARTQNAVKMIRQSGKSHVRCIEGRTWGYDRHGVWVDGGCKAYFEVGHRGRPEYDYRDERRHHDSGNNAAIGGLVVGSIIGAAIASSASDTHHHHHHHQDSNITIKTDRNFKKNWSKGYSPKPGITCFRHQSACYKEGKGFNQKWTQREFK